MGQGRLSAQLPRRIGRFEPAVAARFCTNSLPGARYVPVIRIARYRLKRCDASGRCCHITRRSLLKCSQSARGRAVDGKTVAAYLDLLVDLLLVRRLPPWHRNIGKRLVRSPKVYVRDTGIVRMPCPEFAIKKRCSLIRLVDKPGELCHRKPSCRVTGRDYSGTTIGPPTGPRWTFSATLPNSELWAIEVKRSSGAEDRARDFIQPVL